jgi:hypothetical protein
MKNGSWSRLRPALAQTVGALGTRPGTYAEMSGAPAWATARMQAGPFFASSSSTIESMCRRAPCTVSRISNKSRHFVQWLRPSPREFAHCETLCTDRLLQQPRASTDGGRIHTRPHTCAGPLHWEHASVTLTEAWRTVSARRHSDSWSLQLVHRAQRARLGDVRERAALFGSRPASVGSGDQNPTRTTPETHQSTLSTGQIRFAKSAPRQHARTSLDIAVRRSATLPRPLASSIVSPSTDLHRSISRLKMWWAQTVRQSLNTLSFTSPLPHPPQPQPQPLPV